MKISRLHHMYVGDSIHKVHKLPLLFTQLILSGYQVVKRSGREVTYTRTMAPDKGPRIGEATFSCMWNMPEGPGLAASCGKEASVAMLSLYCFHDPKHDGRLSLEGYGLSL